MFGRRGLESDPGLQDRLRGLNGRADMAPTPPAPPNALSPKPAPAMAQPAASAAPPPASAPSAASPIPTPATTSPQPTISVRNASVTDAAIPRIYPLGRWSASTPRSRPSSSATSSPASSPTSSARSWSSRSCSSITPSSASSSRVLLDDMLGLGPLEPLLADEAITDIMVNGPKQVYVERKGKLELTDVTFRDNAHVMSDRHAHRHAGRPPRRRIDAAGRRAPASTAAASTSSSRRWRSTARRSRSANSPRRRITLDIMSRQQNISPPMATVLKIAARSRLNILISGGTGSGKTTLLNAMSQMIDPASASSPSRTRPSCSCSSRTSCASRRARPTSRARARSPCAIW